MLIWIWLKRFDIKTGGVHREHRRVELSGMGCCWKLRSEGMDHICGSVCFLLRDFHTWVVNLIYPKHQGYYDWTWLWWSTWYMWFMICLLHQRLLKVPVDAISLPLCQQQTNTPDGDEPFQFHERYVCLNLYVVPLLLHNAWRFLAEVQVKTATRCWPETSRWYCLRNQPSVQTEPLGNQRVHKNGQWWWGIQTANLYQIFNWNRKISTCWIPYWSLCKIFYEIVKGQKIWKKNQGNPCEDGKKVENNSKSEDLRARHLPTPKPKLLIYEWFMNHLSQWELVQLPSKSNNFLCTKQFPIWSWFTPYD